MDTSQFIFTTCQQGAERALKAEIARRWPGFRFAFSRPGFVTFKLPPGWGESDAFDLHSVFARTCGLSLGRTTADSDQSRAKQVWQLAAGRPVDHLHVWQRDSQHVGDHGWEPGLTEAAEQAGRLILQARQTGADEKGNDAAAHRPIELNRAAQPGQHVLDCVLVGDDSWWVGVHRVASVPSQWPGGIYPVEVPAEAVSRAYRKMVEALAWSGLPVVAGDRCVEVGSAPGGSCQALLDRGLLVTGIDPSEMHPALLARPGFVHVRKRASDMKRREFRGIKWLVADSNVAPKHTLDTVEAIVTHRFVDVRGLLLTLKLLNWDLADEIPQYLKRIRSWGYADVQARQLAFNRQEICVAAFKQNARKPTGARRRAGKAMRRPKGGLNR